MERDKTYTEHTYIGQQPTTTRIADKAMKRWKGTLVALAIIGADVVFYPLLASQSLAARGVVPHDMPQSFSGQFIYILHMPDGVAYLLMVALFFMLNIAALLSGLYMVFTRYWLSAALFIVYALITTHGATSKPPLPAIIGFAMILVGLWYNFSKKFIILPKDI